MDTNEISSDLQQKGPNPVPEGPDYLFSPTAMEIDLPFLRGYMFGRETQLLFRDGIVIVQNESPID